MINLTLTVLILKYKLKRVLVSIEVGLFEFFD
jgi:hypothetical protein